ncbi:MAG: hypothetical protein CVT74_10975 [Alphaproteobacteria bacterium HGW-Alphaproteobacteria-13]|nr:MAG: hypothetical protein CVT74_10975 [Alphaproteobacteria bacterium HGW-Alphaproteobacteria-13]
MAGAAAVAAIAIAPAGAAPASAPAFLAGAAKVEITPKGAALPAGNTVRDPLFVRAIFLKSGRDCAILASVDKALVATATVDAARARLKQCPGDNIVISATHTHSGADLPAGWMDPAASKLLEDAIVQAAEEAAGKARKARMGFVTTSLDLNINRDAFDGRHWFQGNNPDGVSDKTMTVTYFVGEDDMPIALMMNYGMHPINYHLSGIVSADFPGEASRYVERRYDGAVALFTQAASGDQNPRLSLPLGKLMGPRLHVDQKDAVRAPTFWDLAAEDVRVRPGQKASPAPAEADWDDKRRKAVAEVGEIVTAMGAIMGETAIDAMRDPAVPLVADPGLWAGSATVTCPGRDRIDTLRREGMDPGYKDGAAVNIKVGLLRIGDVALVGVDSEIYTEIVQEMKKRSPLTQTAVIGLAGGLANSGYIYSDNAAHHLTFQVIGSRLQPGCAEDRIVDAAVGLVSQSGRR